MYNTIRHPPAHAMSFGRLLGNSCGVRLMPKRLTTAIPPPSPWSSSISSSIFPSLGPKRPLHSSQARRHGGAADEFASAADVSVRWLNKHGEERVTLGKVGMNLMRVAHANGIDLEGACEGVCACSTCHVILDEDVYSSLPEASEDEEDMLDQAFGLTLTSRLGCQVILTPDLDGIKVQLPSATRNFYVDGHVPQPH